eukprot:scaffold7176_cov134-Cylindrotheca_fusiformis.AAC.6
MLEHYFLTILGISKVALLAEVNGTASKLAPSPLFNAKADSAAGGTDGCYASALEKLSPNRSRIIRFTDFKTALGRTRESLFVSTAARRIRQDASPVHADVRGSSCAEKLLWPEYVHAPLDDLIDVGGWNDIR